MKGNKNLEDYGIKGEDFIILEYADSRSRPRNKNPNAAKKSKDQLITINYNIRSNPSPLEGSIETVKSLKIKQLKKLILNQLGIDDEAHLKVFLKAGAKIKSKEVEEEKGEYMHNDDGEMQMF